MYAFSHYCSAKNISGVTTWLEMLLNGLDRQGETVSINVYHPGIAGQDPSMLSQLHTEKLRILLDQRPQTSQEEMLLVLKFLNEVRPEVFLPQCSAASHFAAKWAQQFGLPWVFAIHSDDPACWALADQTGPDREHGVWVGVSEHIAKLARERYPHAEVYTIPYGVKLPKVRASWNPERFRIVFLGRILEEQKRISHVVQALIEVCQRESHIDAVLMGEGEALVAMRAQVAEAKLSDRIRFTGRLDTEGVNVELAQAQSILLLSEYEGLPVALLQAMSFGVVPVVRYIESGIPEIVHHEQTGLIVHEDGLDPVETMVALSKDPDRWEKLSRESASFIAEHYSDASNLRKWQEVMASAKAKAKAPVNYPIPLPEKVKLPPLDPRLASIDRRPLSVLQRAKRKLRHLMRKRSS